MILNRAALSAVAALSITAVEGPTVGPASAAPPGQTQIAITVVDSDGCKIQPVQN